DQGIERRPNRAPRVQHVVDEQDLLVVDREGDLGLPDERLRSDRVPDQIVAIQGDVEGAGRDVVPVDVADRAREPLRDRHAAGPDADERELVDAAVAFENLVGDAREGSTDAVGVEDDWHDTSSRSRWSALKSSRSIISHAS